MKPSESKELLYHIERGRNDIVYFAWYFLGITLHPGQIRIAREANGQINVIVPGNRYGKTVFIAVRHIWYSYYKIGYESSNSTAWGKVRYRTCALAPDSKILILDWQTIMDIMQSKFNLAPKGEAVRTNECRLAWYLVPEHCKTTPLPFIQFLDNSGIEFYSTANDKGTSVQGRFFGYGSYDEGGRSHWLDIEINQNIGPRFSELNAPLDLVSTPAVDSPSLAFHYDIFHKGLRGDEGYKSFEGSAYENVYLPKVYFEREETRLKGNPLRDQVMEGKFAFAGATMFPLDQIERAKDETLNMGHPYYQNRRYVISVDTAMGSDEMVYMVIDITERPLRLVRMVATKGNAKSPQLHYADFENLVRQYKQGNNVQIMLETWNGESASFWHAMPYDLQNITKTYGSWTPPTIKKKPGQTNEIKKKDIQLALIKVLADGDLRIPNEPELIRQLSLYREDDDRLRNDRVIALCLGVWLATDGQPKNPTIQAKSVSW